ncbi:MAG: hypothetical protein O2V44_05640 [Candidatus Bathyarchaeota archaeon]|nr:hypothetical protein [Candidatus Bathyarchaeota archaeon]
MGNNWERILFLGKYLIPKNNVWSRRICLLFGFILFDYFVTLVFCTAPMEEANPHLRVFMENYGILLGLTIFDFIINLPVYLILSFNSRFISLPARLSKIVEPLVDVVLAWFLAGAHFSGAASWFWTAPDWARQITGFGIYLFIATVLSMKVQGK